MGSGPGNEVIGNAGQLSVRSHVSVGGSGVEPLPGLQELILLRVELTLRDDLNVSLGIITEVISKNGAEEQAEGQQGKDSLHHSCWSRQGSVVCVCVCEDIV